MCGRAAHLGYLPQRHSPLGFSQGLISLDWLASKLWGSSCPCPLTHAGIIDMRWLFSGRWESELRFSCYPGKHTTTELWPQPQESLDFETLFSHSLRTGP